MVFQATAPVVATWKMFHHDLSHTGRSQADTSAVQGKQKWTFQTEDTVRSSPAVDADGIIYVGSDDKNLYAINPDGSLKWKLATGDIVYSSPAVGDDGTICVGSFDKNLYAINPNGTVKWKFATREVIESSPAVSGKRLVGFVVAWEDVTIYAGSGKNLFAVK